jgi:hypothetical protein
LWTRILISFVIAGVVVEVTVFVFVGELNHIIVSSSVGIEIELICINTSIVQPKTNRIDNPTNESDNPTIQGLVPSGIRIGVGTGGLTQQWLLLFLLSCYDCSKI